jgi:hypothetical protein
LELSQRKEKFSFSPRFFQSTEFIQEISVIEDDSVSRSDQNKKSIFGVRLIVICLSVLRKHFGERRAKLSREIHRKENFARDFSVCEREKRKNFT